jgi:TIR domain-containing protein
MRIFLAIPITKHFKDISKIINQIITDNRHEINTIDVAISSGTIIEQINDEIKKSDLVIADVTNRDPHVMYELGVAQSLKKPILPIIQQGESIPFDIASMPTIIYERNSLSDTLGIRLHNYFKKSSSKNFIDMKISEYKKEKKNIKTVFVSYSHKDIDFLNRLKVHLKPFEKSGSIDLWADTEIKAGDKWEEEIKKALKRSAIAILLISADFLASDFIIDNELPPLLAAAEKKGKEILLVIIKPCRFSKDKNLSKFQSFNDPKIPLSKMTENSREEFYVRIGDYIEDFIK